MESIKALVCAIFEQAIEDYKSLNINHIEIKKDSQGTGLYSVKDIEIFFRSKWCARLLEMIDIDFSGVDILNEVQSQCAHNEEVL